MIKKFLKKILGKTTKKTSGVKSGRLDHDVSIHKINTQYIDPDATKVVQTLQNAHHEAYIVGGAVRDLILNLNPKDFDVATTATPEQVKSLFRRAFIIGRRFRIVHVVFGRGKEHNLIEVTTFRANVDNREATLVAGNERSSRAQLSHTKHAVAHSGRVLRDNVWGTLEEDAMRRDFTINALYYNPKNQTVVDFHHGFEDAQNRIIRMIGDPEQRYREDPVRMLRAIRFAAKLSPLHFQLDAATSAPLKKCQPLLRDIPQSRLFDEMLKLLQTGHALASIEQLKHHGFDHDTFALLDLIVARSNEPLVNIILRATDQRIKSGLPVTASFLLAGVLWSDVQNRLAHHKARMPLFPAMDETISEVFKNGNFDISVNGKLASEIREIWVMQLRFDKRVGKSAYSLLQTLRFRAALDFLEFRAQSEPHLQELAVWWRDFYGADDEKRTQLLASVISDGHVVKKKRKRKPKASSSPDLENAVGENSEPAPRQKQDHPSLSARKPPLNDKD